MFINLISDSPPRLGVGHPALGFALSNHRPKRGQRIRYDNRYRGSLQMVGYGWTAWNPECDWKPKRGPYRRISALGWQVKAVKGAFIKRMAP